MSKIGLGKWCYMTGKMVLYIRRSPCHNWLHDSLKALKAFL